MCMYVLCVCARACMYACVHVRAQCDLKQAGLEPKSLLLTSLALGLQVCITRSSLIYLFHSLVNLPPPAPPAAQAKPESQGVGSLG